MKRRGFLACIMGVLNLRLPWRRSVVEEANWSITDKRAGKFTVWNSNFDVITRVYDGSKWTVVEKFRDKAMRKT